MPGLDSVSGADHWGAINLGGAMISGGGLVFVAGAPDQLLRAFDVATGRQLWQGRLPAAGNALPMTYQLSDTGRQFVVIAAGGREPIWKQGDYLVAFALPRDTTPPPAGVHSPVGAWSGQMIVERHRWPATLDLRLDDGVPTGTLRVTPPGITGTLTGTTFGNRLTFHVEFTYPAQHCRGEMRGIAELANDGHLLVGEIHVSGECSGAEPEDGTIALRR